MARLMTDMVNKCYRVSKMESDNFSPNIFIFFIFPVTEAVEDKYVFVNESLTINGGQGLFAKIDIPGGTNFAYFGGHVYTAKQWNKTTFFDPNYFAKFKDGKQQYYIHLPDEFGNDLNLYR